jgi:hypothetical protein
MFVGVVPEGLNDGSQALQCLDKTPDQIRPVGNGMIRSSRRITGYELLETPDACIAWSGAAACAPTIRLCENQGSLIIPYPPGRMLSLTNSRQ